MHAERDASKFESANISMKFLNTLAIVAVIVAFGAIARSVVVLVGVPGMNPAIRCTGSEWDCGEVAETAAVEHSFRVENSGWSKLAITKVNAACRCSKVRPREFPQIVPSGGSLDVVCRLNLRGMSGSFRKTITVESNDPAQPALTLVICGSVKAERNHRELYRDRRLSSDAALGAGE